MAVPAPKAEELHVAARALGLQSVIDPDRAHPSTPWQKDGRVLIQGNFVKSSVLRKIAEKVKTTRSQPARTEQE